VQNRCPWRTCAVLRAAGSQGFDGGSKVQRRVATVRLRRAETRARTRRTRKHGAKYTSGRRHPSPSLIQLNLTQLRQVLDILLRIRPRPGIRLGFPGAAHVALGPAPRSTPGPYNIRKLLRRSRRQGKQRTQGDRVECAEECGRSFACAAPPHFFAGGV